jgi:alpha-1,3-mannosyl-glycoprotein beta-1,2-N-acetylglucosaminyltransferase
VSYLVSLSDDLIIAPDFYMYFSALWSVLNSDPTLMCVSAYADNGKAGYVDPQQAGEW